VLEGLRGDPSMRLYLWRQWRTSKPFKELCHRGILKFNGVGGAMPRGSF
jgi:hypothetical protein